MDQEESRIGIYPGSLPVGVFGALSKDHNLESFTYFLQGFSKSVKPTSWSIALHVYVSCSAIEVDSGRHPGQP